MTDIEPGQYKHYQRDRTVTVKGLAWDAISGVELVIFEESDTTLVMTIEEFTKQQMDEDGKAVPRYQRIGDVSQQNSEEQTT